MQTPVPGAADWSKIVFDNELNSIFHQEEKQTTIIPTTNAEQSSTSYHSTEQPSVSGNIHMCENVSECISNSLFLVYPSWCSQTIVFLPLVYQQVYEASYQFNAIQTSVLYPILLLSGLRQDQLSQIWSQVNLTQPGTLMKEELFMALALIALAQNSNGQIFSNNDLHHLTDIPIPHFQIQQEQQPSVPVVSVSPPPSPPPPPVVYQQEDFADFTSFDNVIQTNQTQDATLLLDFADNHLYPTEIKPASSETQSLASLDFPMPTLNLNNPDSTSQKGNSDNLSLNSSNTNEMNPVVDTQSLHSINFSESSKLGIYFDYYGEI